MQILNMPPDCLNVTICNVLVKIIRIIYKPLYAVIHTNEKDR